MKEVKDKDKSDVELVYQALKANGQQAHFRDLMNQLFETKGMPVDPYLMASIHTQMNMDNRFQFLGQSNWGLREWTQGKVVRRSVPSPTNTQSGTVRRRSLQDELEYEDGQYTENYKNVSTDNDDDDDWEE